MRSRRWPKETAIGETAGPGRLRPASRDAARPQAARPGMSTNVLGAQADNFVTNPQYGP